MTAPNKKDLIRSLSIREELIRFLKGLENIPENKAGLIEYIVIEIKDRNLPNSDEGKQIAGGLLNLLAELIPQINTSNNRHQVNNLEKKFDAAIHAEKTATPRVTRKK